MKTRLVLVVVACLLPLPAAAAASPSDPAELLPARTLAYLELSDPARCADELRALVKNSYLEDPLRMLIPARRAGVKSEELVYLGLGASPEVLGELADWQGSAVALTGFTSQQYPEIIGVLRTGRSRMVPLAVRTFLAAKDEVRLLRRVEGVDIYQIGPGEKAQPRALALARTRRTAVAFGRALVPPVSRKVRAEDVVFLQPPPLPAPVPGPDFAPPANLIPAAPGVAPAPVPPAADTPAGPEEPPEFGFFCSLMPGAVVCGTTPDGVSDTVARLKGKTRGPTLAQSAAYREAAATRRRPDLFVYLDPPALTRSIDDSLEKQLLDRKAEVRQQNKTQRDAEKTEAEKKAKAAQLPKELEEAERQHRLDNAAWYVLRTLANPAGMRFLTTSVTLHDTSFTWRIDARMREGETSPLLEVLADKPSGEDLLRGLPRDTFFLVALPLGDAADTWQKVLRAADACYEVIDPKEPAPGKLVRDFEKQMKLLLARDLFARVKGVAWGVRIGATEKDEGVDCGPGVLAVEAKDEAAARAIEDLLPRLLTGGPKPAMPRAVRVSGQTVQSLIGDEAKAPAILPAFYGRRGTVVVVGWDRRDVALALRDGGEPVELRDHPRALAALRDAGPAGAAALFSGRQTLASLTRLLSHAADQKPKNLRQLAYLREASAPMAVMPPTLFRLNARRDGLHFEMTQPDVRVASATVIDMFVAFVLDEHSGKD